MGKKAYLKQKKKTLNTKPHPLPKIKLKKNPNPYYHIFSVSSVKLLAVGYPYTTLRRNENTTTRRES